MTLMFLEMKLSGLYIAKSLYAKSLSDLRNLESIPTDTHSIEQLRINIVEMQPNIEKITSQAIKEFKKANIAPNTTLKVKIGTEIDIETWYTENGFVEIIPF